jgi:diadenosine tetraphosphatase ApaH/serine/threonine PP2A family protein phosphatase
VILALLSDIHANLEALDACLRHAHEQGAGRYAFLGDFVGYGADPQAVVDKVARYAADGAIAVQGNHDAAVGSDVAYMNDSARAAVAWTRTVLSGDAKSFLAALPLCVREETICFVHSSATAPERWDYVDGTAAARRSLQAAGTTYTFSGHVHDQELYFSAPQDKVAAFRPLPGREVPVAGNRRWLALVGSVGQPRDRNPAAAYALFDVHRARLTFHRVAYDHTAAARKIRAAGLPASIAYRIEKGI